MNYDELEFKVELEFTGITRLQASNILVNALDENGQEYKEDMCEYPVMDAIRRIWLISESLNVVCEQEVANLKELSTNNYSVELVTPCLNYIEIPFLQEIIRQFKQAGAFVNESSKIHIQVNIEEFDIEDIKNLCTISYTNQDLMYKTLNTSDKGLRRCKKLSKDFIKKLNKRRPQTIRELRESCCEDLRSVEHSRIHFLNLYNLFIYKDKMVEFRLFNSTLNTDELKSYIDLSLLLVVYSYNIKLKNYNKMSSKYSEKYSFMKFLMEIGLKGDEFKVTRYHLLKNLSDNISDKDIN